MDGGSYDIIKEAGIKTIPKKKKCKKAKWLSEEALQIVVKRKKVKSKREKERYKHLNAEFQRIARRYKTAVLSDQCKVEEANNRIGKTRDHFKKLRDTKGTFHKKDGLNKDRNGIDLTEAKDIKKRWQEYRKGLYKRDLHDPDNHNRMVLIPVSCTMSQTSVHSPSGTQSMRSSPLNLFLTSTV